MAAPTSPCSWLDDATGRRRRGITLMETDPTLGKLYGDTIRKPPPHPAAFRRAMVDCAYSRFARSPQAKGRVERMAGTFQDRLVTELWDARTIDQANAVLRDFLPRYNAQFAVPAELPEPAYRTWDPQRNLAEIL